MQKPLYFEGLLGSVANQSFSSATEPKYPLFSQKPLKYRILYDLCPTFCLQIRENRPGKYLPGCILLKNT